MNPIQISKSQFKAKALEYFRQVETTGASLVITDHGRPSLEIRPYQGVQRGPLAVLRDTVVHYGDPTVPVDEDDWDAAK